MKPQSLLAVVLSALWSVALLIGAPPAILASPQQDEAFKYLKQGLARQEANQFQAAIELYKKAIELDPRLVPAHFNLGVAHLQLKQLAQAMSAFKRLTEIDPDFAEAYASLGMIYLSEQNYQKAANEFEQALRLKPDFEQLRPILAGVYEKLGRKADADAVLKRSAEPEDARQFYVRGFDLLRLGQLELALKPLQRAVELDPDFADAYRALAQTYLLMKRPNDMLPALEKLAVLKVEEVFVYHNLGTLYWNLKRYKECAEALQTFSSSATVCSSCSMSARRR
jgi:tetratricopeptide (TPR) repeat protein